MASIRNAVNFSNSHQRQIDEVTLCEPKRGDSEMGLRDSKIQRDNGFFGFCTTQRIQCLLLGVIAFILIIVVGHVMHLKNTTLTTSGAGGNLFLNLTHQMNEEMRLIRLSLTRNDYKDPQAVCPSNLYTVVGPPGFWSSCYLIGGEGQLDWQAAREFCQDKGGDLVAIESEIEDKFLDKEIRKLSNTFSYWIGGSDGGRLSLKKGDWFWVGSNEKINYSHWSYNTPNNKNGNEDCLSLSNSNWDDLPCSTKQPVICEAKVPSASTQVKPHVFVKPMTICPLSEHFTNPGVFTTSRPTTTSSRYFSNRHGRAITTTKAPLESQNSTAKSCYMFMDGKMSWRTAQEFCEQYGGYLATIETQEENDYLYTMLKSISSKTANWWIGGNDFEAGENNWIWTSSKIRLDAGFQDWTLGQPDNGGGDFNKHGDENCLSMIRIGYGSPHRWVDQRCGMWQPSICEVPNPNYNGSDALDFNHDVENYISESLCMADKGTSECVNGTWTCYTFVRLQKTWNQAKEFCASRGGALAGPDTREKADAVYLKAKQYVSNSNAYYWLGATDAESEGHWRWVKNNKSAPPPARDEYIPYPLVSPDRFIAPDRNCLRMDVESFRTRMNWEDAKCDQWGWFVCEHNSCDNLAEQGVSS